jgi:hypothetical protein
MITDRDVREQVATAVNAGGEELAAGIDVDGIVDEILSRYGLVDIEVIDNAEFWKMVTRHDSTQS